MALDDSQQRRLRAQIEAMRRAFVRYTFATDEQEATMHLRRQRCQDFDEAYEEALNILATD